MAATAITFEEFRKQMIVEAKNLCSEDNYPGDEFYMQDDECWRGPWEDGMTPRDTVISDMEYWEP